MNVSKKGLWQIIYGAIIVVLMANILPMFLGGSTQAKAGLAMSFLAIIFGLYLIYRGFYPKSR